MSKRGRDTPASAVRRPASPAEGDPGHNPNPPRSLQATNHRHEGCHCPAVLLIGLAGSVRSWSLACNPQRWVEAGYHCVPMCCGQFMRDTRSAIEVS